MSFFCHELERERDALILQLNSCLVKLDQAEEKIEDLQERLYLSQASNNLLKQALDER